MGDADVVFKKPWRKKLYENEGYPDNHTDRTFLEEMRKNIHDRQTTYKTAFIGAGMVVQEFCLVVLFIAIFLYLYNDWVKPEALFGWSTVASAVGYLLYIWKSSVRKLSHFKAILMYLIFGYLLSPALQTLTQTISTDTIYSMTLFMMAIHLIFFDYGVKVLIVSSSLSINAAIFGSICLVSRLPSPFYAFVLLTAAIECFVLCPLLLSKLGNSCYIQLLMVIINVYLLSFSSTAALVFLLSSVFLGIVCPILFVRWQVYKDNIYGPWDEATVNA